MVGIHTLLKALAFCALNPSLLAQAQVIFVLPDPSCSATPEMVHAGLLAFTDPNCLEPTDEPGCNLFGLPDCRACALLPDAVADNVPPCELLDIFTQESEELGGEPVDCEGCDCEPGMPRMPVEADRPTDSSEEDYVPIVIVLPTDIFIEAESSLWTDSDESGSGESDDGEDGQDDARRLRAQL